MVKELRAIPPPEWIGIPHVDGGPIYDTRLPKHSLWGPLKSVHDFHLELRKILSKLSMQATENLLEFMTWFCFMIDAVRNLPLHTVTLATSTYYVKLTLLVM